MHKQSRILFKLFTRNLKNGQTTKLIIKCNEDVTTDSKHSTNILRLSLNNQRYLQINN